MQTQCKTEKVKLQGLGAREIIADFNGGDITSDGGVVLLREVEEAKGIIKSFSNCFKDSRDQRYVEHPLEDLLAQRIYALCLGYEDVNDHDELRNDPCFAVAVGKNEIGPGDGKYVLAGKSTLNRLELVAKTEDSTDRYHKIRYDKKAVDSFMVEMFLKSKEKAPKEIILDVDATDDLIHGAQEGKFFHGYYGCYCYLPLYIFCGDSILYAELRKSDIDASKGTVEALGPIVREVRQKWPEVRIIIRGDGGFCREQIMAWCEAEDVDFVFGLAKNARLKRKIEKQQEKARRKSLITGKSARYYRDFKYQTLKTWNRKRRVVGKAEHLEKGANPRFVVTSLKKDEINAQGLYESLYCARGDMENRIKEQQLALFADRTSTATMRGNQLRLWLSSVAYMLMEELRRVGLKGTEYERAQCDTIRNKLLKIGGLIKISVRKIWFHFSSAYPYKGLLLKVIENLHSRYTTPLRI